VCRVVLEGVRFRASTSLLAWSARTFFKNKLPADMYLSNKRRRALSLGHSRALSLGHSRATDRAVCHVPVDRARGQ
jgi:hypothetical protein